MKENVGSMDQYIRYAAGLAILSAGVAYESMWGLLGIMPIMTALLAWCPPYALLGLMTKK
jgi:Inner membrane protein YgaP-like, transmembrane domain